MLYVLKITWLLGIRSLFVIESSTVSIGLGCGKGDVLALETYLRRLYWLTNYDIYYVEYMLIKYPNINFNG